ncbi:uncharacterized protein Dvir_GJ26289 [Drosophila virilis]|uniref:Uncharacterized protein n=1 Tax=Drosophila virilis TaxID=7244 RepID=A0A0Q9WGK5_DROVI|nr:uncharacterized protein Dvir_GJ26289 [Drosophila virilis]
MEYERITESNLVAVAVALRLERVRSVNLY